MYQRYARWFIKSAGVLLFLTALAKGISGYGGAEVLNLPDPVFLIPFRYMFLGVGVIEAGIAVACLLEKPVWMQASLVAWISFSFVLYRICLSVVGYEKPCPCLGSLTGALHLQPRTADVMLRIILGYLLAGSYATLLCVCKWSIERKRRAKDATEMASGSALIEKV